MYIYIYICCACRSRHAAHRPQLHRRPAELWPRSREGASRGAARRHGDRRRGLRADAEREERGAARPRRHDPRSEGQRVHQRVPLLYNMCYTM